MPGQALNGGPSGRAGARTARIAKLLIAVPGAFPSRSHASGRAAVSLPCVSSEAPRPGPPAHPAEVEGTDATRRTRLANERTYLAWWRTGLAAIAVGVGAGKVVPLLGNSNQVQWPYTVAGAGFTAMGVLCIVFGLVRQREVERALARGEFAPPDNGMVLALTILGAAFGLLLLVVVIATS